VPLPSACLHSYYCVVILTADKKNTMEKVTKFIIITVLQKIWILFYGIKNSIFLDADTSISEMPPVSTLVCPKHGVLPREVGIHLAIYGVIYFPGDQTLHKHRPRQNSRSYSPASHRWGLGSIPGNFIWIFFKQTDTGTGIHKLRWFSLVSNIPSVLHIFIYLFILSIIYSFTSDAL
jgi:hypothetical protein